MQLRKKSCGPSLACVAIGSYLSFPCRYSAHFAVLCYTAMVMPRAVAKRRRRIDRSMIGEPTNFVHTAHVGSGDLFSGMNSVSSIQNQMQSKGGYGGGMSANVQMQLVDTKAG
ncbi:Cdc42se2 [Columba guinea]|nr:Cdc42se2 [Columba guinea]